VLNGHIDLKLMVVDNPRHRQAFLAVASIAMPTKGLSTALLTPVKGTPVRSARHIHFTVSYWPAVRWDIDNAAALSATMPVQRRFAG
jgi:hypothetical protein